MTYKLSDIAIIQTGPFGSQLHKEDYKSSGTPIVTVEHLGKRRFSTQNLPLVGEEDGDRLAKYKMKAGDIIFSRVGSVDRCSFATTDEEGWLFSGRCLCVRPFSDKVDSEWLYYYLTTDNFKAYIRSIAVGATMPSINTKILSEILIDLPPITFQRRIAGFLNAIDKKIEVNSKINGCLLEQIRELTINQLTTFADLEAHASYSLPEIATFVNGYSYKGNELVSDSEIALVGIKNFDRNGGFKMDGFKPIVPSPKVKAEQFLNQFDLMVACTDLTQGAEVIGNAELITTFGRYCRAIMSMDLVKVVNKDAFPKFVLAAVLMSDAFKNHCLGYVNGTTVLHLRKEALYDFKFGLRGSPSTLEPLFEKLYAKMASIASENEKLSCLRDSLLPKLMSGEIDVDSIDIG